MDWSTKIPSHWDWENLMFGGKPIDSNKQIQPTDWGIEGDGGIENGSLYSSGGGAASASRSGSGSGSGSDLGNSSSSKSSISASVDSSSNIASRTSTFNFDSAEGSREDLNARKELGRLDNTGTSPPFAPAGASTEPLIGLRLGKRTYFEDVCAGSAVKPPSLSVIPSSPAAVAAVTAAATAKRSRASCQSTQTPHCQVEGCNLDLTLAKDYHRRHRVCENHSKCPKVIVAGLERRFCQQCSRFHDLSEFDEKKRSCRRRLSDHNARRRKPQPDAVQFNSGRLPSSFYDGTPQLNVLLNSVPLVHARPSAKPTWENAWSFKPGEAKGSLFKPAKVGGINGQLHLPTNLPNAVSTLHRDSCRLLPNKGTTTEVLNQGIESPGIPSNLDATTDLPRALSLLSNNNSWESGLHEPASLDQLMQANQACITQPMMHTSPQGWAPLTSSEYWQAEQRPPPAEAESRVHSLTSHNNDNNDGSSQQFQEFQLFKAPFDSAFYCNRIN